MVTVSSEKAWKVEQLYPEVATRFIANGIDLADWQPTPSEQSFAENWRAEHTQGRLVLGLVGQLKAKKGLSFLLESLQHHELAEKLHLLLIGELAEDVSTALEATACSYTHLPFLDRFELLKYYPCCDGICIPSFYDGMPNVLLEAGGLGIPILASDVDGMHDVLHVIAPQLLFAPGDAHGLRKA
ncbi:MAG TPA: glycogen synthase, partial [Cytophagales bacterium]|nr:glycogen synthase [Cytophagales bacterium]